MFQVAIVTMRIAQLVRFARGSKEEGPEGGRQEKKLGPVQAGLTSGLVCEVVPPARWGPADPARGCMQRVRAPNLLQQAKENPRPGGSGTRVP